MYYTGIGVKADNSKAAEFFKKACDGDFMSACSGLGGMYFDGIGVKVDKNRAAKLLKKACGGGVKDACELYDKVANQNNISSSKQSFVVDGLYSGMHFDEVLDKKFTKNTEGEYMVKHGTMDMITSMMYGNQISGYFLQYDTQIMGKSAIISVYFTEHSKVIYAVLVEWNQLSMEGGFNFYDIVGKALTLKYGQSKALPKEDMITNSEQWKQPGDVKITSNIALDGGMNMKIFITYVDDNLKKLDKKEQQTPISTNKL